MTCRYLLPLLALGLAGWGFAFEAADPTGERLAQFERDAGLIDAFVKGGLRLAKESDALERARVCNELADHVAKEMRQAAGQSNGRRTAELGVLYQDVLVRGVADNLSLARASLPADSPKAKEIVQVGEKINLDAKPLEKEVGKLTDNNKEAMETALQAIAQAQAQVTSSSQGKSKSPPQTKGKGKGKSNKSRD